jgi:hypothetical protein
LGEEGFEKKESITPTLVNWMIILNDLVVLLIKMEYFLKAVAVNLEREREL